MKKKKKKLSLKELKVDSFTTSFNTEKGETADLKGGMQLTSAAIDCDSTTWLTNFASCDTRAWFCPGTG